MCGKEIRLGWVRLSWARLGQGVDMIVYRKKLMIVSVRGKATKAAVTVDEGKHKTI